jgi:hypothetical protein
MKDILFNDAANLLSIILQHNIRDIQKFFATREGWLLINGMIRYPFSIVGCSTASNIQQLDATVSWKMRI